MLDDDVRAVQRAFPQIYFACHTRHQQPGRPGEGLSPRDATLLSHLFRDRPVRPRALARHLNVGAPTISEAVERLVGAGLVDRRREGDDRRAVALRLTDRGEQALARGSVLDAAAVAAVLRRLAPSERRRAVEGLSALARASNADVAAREGP